ncbi:MAG: SH3 domain-containing protein [Chloroflexia bacterium]|nr:SH3 domain-containing protein [Chloroflexia bacterium]
MPERRRRVPRAVWGALAGVTVLAALVAALAFLSPLGPGTLGAPVVPNMYPSASERAPESSRHGAIVTADVLNIREAASGTSSILGSVTRGQRVTIVGGPVDGFVPVAYGAVQAWVAEAYLASATSTAGGERWIDVHRGTAAITLHEGGRIVATFHGAVGGDRSNDGYYATAPGTFHVYSMAKDLTWTRFADDGYITDWVGFDPTRSNGFHSPIRDESGAEKPVQSTVTKGCVRLTGGDAAVVFAFASIGMRVEVHD